MLIKFKRSHPDARIPTQAAGDVGFDLYSVEDITIPAGRVQKVKTGLHIADYDPTVVVHQHGKSVVSLSEGTYTMPTAGAPYDKEALTVYPKMEGRSSLGAKGIFTIAGIIDPIYRGELCVTLANMTGEDYRIQKGDKIAQFVFYTCLASPGLTFEETDELTMTRRGDRGFGSTGR